MAEFHRFPCLHSLTMGGAACTCLKPEYRAVFITKRLHEGEETEHREYYPAQDYTHAVQIIQTHTTVPAAGYRLIDVFVETHEANAWRRM